MVGCTRSIAVSGSSLRSNWTSTEWRSGLIVSVVTLATTGTFPIVLATSVTAAAKAGSLAVADLLCTSTISPDFSGNPASWRIVSARRVSPSIFWASVGVLEPSALPAKAITMIIASHPKMAVLRCRALQCPARAAMPRGVVLIRDFLSNRGVLVVEVRIAVGGAAVGGGGWRPGVPIRLPDGVRVASSDDGLEVAVRGATDVHAGASWL